MIFGDPAVFAIQIDLEDHSQYLNGEMFYWIAGGKFGFASNALFGAIGDLAVIIKDSGTRSDPALLGLPDAATFRFINRHLFGWDLDETLEEAARFNITPPFQGQSTLVCFAIEDRSEHRLLLGDYMTGLRRVHRCPTDLLDSSFLDAYQYLNSINPPEAHL